MDQRLLGPLRTWLAEVRGRQAALAASLKVSPSVVAAWLSGRRPVPPEHAASIERFTGGAVTRKAMFPGDWRRIWPELADAKVDTAPALTGQAQAAINSESRQQAQEGAHA